MLHVYHRYLIAKCSQMICENCYHVPKALFFSLYLSEKYEQNKNQGRTRNEFLMLLADLFFVQFSSHFFIIFIQLSRYVNELKTSI